MKVFAGPGSCRLDRIRARDERDGTPKSAWRRIIRQSRPTKLAGITMVAFSNLRKGRSAERSSPGLRCPKAGRRIAAVLRFGLAGIRLVRRKRSLDVHRHAAGEGRAGLAM